MIAPLLARSFRDVTQTKTHAQTVLKLLAGELPVYSLILHAFELLVDVVLTRKILVMFASSFQRRLTGGTNIFAELDTYERRFVSEEEEQKKEPSERTKSIGLTTPTFTWKPADFDGAKTLILLKSGR